MVADHLTIDLKRLHTADINTDTGIVLQRQTAGRSFGVAVHDADLLTQLVDENNGAVVFGDGAGQPAHGLAHEPGKNADDGVADLTFQLTAGDQGGDRVDDHDVHGAGADKRLTDVERLLAGVRLGNQQLVNIHAQSPRIGGFQRVLHIDVSGGAALLLGGSNHMERQSRLTGGLGSIDLHNAPLRHTADAQRQVQRERTGGKSFHIHGNIVAQTHDGALAVIAFDLLQNGLERLLSVLGVPGFGNRRDGDLFLFSHRDSISFLSGFMLRTS